MKRQQVLHPGASVYSADGQKVGTMQTYGDSYIVVEKGFFFPKDYYIPMSAITETTDDAVYLSVTKDDALHQGWDQMSTDSTSTGQHAESGDERTETHTTGYRDQERVSVPVYEEHLEGSKHLVDAGNVTISKHVVTDQETIEVPVSEERVRVDWREPTGEKTDDGIAFEEGSIDIPVNREEVDVSKRKVQTGEVQVTKELQQRTQKVTGEVRREVIDVDDPAGNANQTTQSRQSAR